MAIRALSPIRLPVSGESSHVAEPVELLVEGFRPSRSGQEHPSREGAEHRGVEPQGRAQHGAAPATHVDLTLGGIELELSEIALAHPAPADAMQHRHRGIVDDATAVLERSFDQLDLLASILRESSGAWIPRDAMRLCAESSSVRSHSARTRPIVGCSARAQRRTRGVPGRYSGAQRCGHPNSREKGQMVPKHYFEVMCCPDCRTDLRESSDDLQCSTCRRRYPVVNGIPVLISGNDDEVSGVVAKFYASAWKRDDGAMLAAKVLHEDTSDLGQRYIHDSEARFLEL